MIDSGVPNSVFPLLCSLWLSEWSLVMITLQTIVQPQYANIIPQCVQPTPLLKCTPVHGVKDVDQCV